VNLRAACLAVLVTAAVLPACARELATGTGAFLDMPSGFSPGDGDGETRFSYFDPDGGMEFDILIYDKARYGTAETMAADLAGQMGSQGDVSSFTYQGRGAVIAGLAFSTGTGPRKGYGMFIVAAPGDLKDYALVATAESSLFDTYSELIISCIDSFSIDREARRFPGPVSQFLFPWPAVRGEKKTAVLPSGNVTLPWSTAEEQQELSVAEREYRILTLYLDSQTLWVDAWARYYRMVYKESAARLDSLVDAFARNLPSADPTESARRVLAWVQGFVYERDFAGIDFVPPLTAAFESRGDCDSRAMVMAVILERLGIDSILMVSRDYSHAMLAVNVPGAGQRFPFSGRSYLVAETTAKVSLGTMDASLSDFSRWLGIDLGN
jgi:hypothetical protein